MSRWKMIQQADWFNCGKVHIEWHEQIIIEEESHHWFRLGYEMQDLILCYSPYWQNKPPMLVRKSDFVDGVLQINDDHPLKWLYDRVENDDE